ncbi:hypothetical protein PRZ48_009772 [Zasmidium cellare]|uniref:Uncharacterized protein n=1 Tax=Zasmidium cellare TaxID=395010 RepID=A0ABR0ED27_ZASCE|nr:hypothetical protein PRZ48_009772 [Zasmidium cellare]
MPAKLGATCFGWRPRVSYTDDTRFSTLGGEFSVTDTRQSWDHEPTEQWLSRHRRLDRQVDVLDDYNFEQWIITMESILRKLGLWTHAKHPYLAHLKLDEDWADDWLRDDVWATNIMLMHIEPSTLIRYDLPRPLTSSELLYKLSEGPNPFRFLDLPREIRDEITRLVVVKQPFMKSVLRQDGSEFIREDDDLGKIELMEDFAIPQMMQVNRQIRHEASTIYWQENHFRLFYCSPSRQTWAPFKALRRFKKRIDAEGLLNLRELSLDVRYYKDWQTHAHVKYRPDTGLQAEVRPASAGSHDCLTGAEDVRRRDAYCAKMHQRQADGDFEGNGVFDFFLDDTREFKAMLWGRPTKRVKGSASLERVECDPQDPEARFNGPW